MTRPELDHVVIHIDDWEACHTFYVGVLGCERVANPEGRSNPLGGWALRLGSQQINVHGPWPGMETPCCPPPFNEVGRADLAFRTQLASTANLDLLRRHAVEVIDGPVRRFGAMGWGTSIYCSDPSGNGVELISYDEDERGAGERHEPALMDDCIACELADGRRPLPGGRIFRTDHWLVEHCVGPLGLGTLIVKPQRHVTGVGGLTEAEAAELGPLLRTTSDIAQRLVGAEQTYNCLWSHAGGVAGHVHYVVQPVTAEQMSEFAAYGPNLQAAMFERGETPHAEDIVRIAEAARRAFASR